MIRSKLRRLRFDKEEQERRKLTYEVMQAETGLASNTLARFFKDDPLDRLDGQVLSTLCRYFDCEVGDVLEYVADGEAKQ